MDRFWVISDSKYVPFFEKKKKNIMQFWHTFVLPDHLFFESLITHKRSIFEQSYISYDKRQKSCTLIVV